MYKKRVNVHYSPGEVAVYVESTSGSALQNIKIACYSCAKING